MLAQWKFEVQSASTAQAAASHRWVALQTLLGPQSASVPQPLVQKFWGWAPPWKQAQGLSQMRPWPASWQSASFMQLPPMTFWHCPLQKAGRRSTPQKSPDEQSLCERHWPFPLPPVPPEELEVVVDVVVFEVLDVVADPPSLTAVEPFELDDPHAATAPNARDAVKICQEGKRMR
jgi:hypothetical protein